MVGLLAAMLAQKEIHVPDGMIHLASVLQGMPTFLWFLFLFVSLGQVLFNLQYGKLRKNSDNKSLMIYLYKWLTFHGAQARRKYQDTKRQHFNQD